MMDPMQSTQSTESETEPTGDEAGYTICIDCLPSGTYRTRKIPLHQEQEQEDGPTAEGLPGPDNEAMDVESFEQALKAAVMIYRQNPMDSAEQAQMEAGYQARSGA